MQAKLSAIGMYVPDRVVDNQYFESLIDTNDEWIVSRTGIKTRRYVAPDQYTSDLCLLAIKNLVDNSGADLSDVDMILVSTVTPDQPMPSMACRLQYKLNLSKAGALDIYAACAGFAYGITLAKGLIAAESHRKIIVVGADNLTRITDYTDRTSCMLFGDGAGAVLIEAAEKGNIGNCITGAYGEGGIDLYISGFADTLDGQPLSKTGKIVQNGRKVFKWAVNTVSEQIGVILAKNNMTLDEIDWFVPHSANLRIIEAICHETGHPLSKTLESIVEYGNTSSASIPLALCNGIRDGKLKSGDKVLLLGFGGGLAFAGAIIVWP